MNITSAAYTSAQVAADARVKMFWHQLPPGLNPADVLDMPFGGERNLAMRKALGIELNANEVCVVNQGDVIQVVVPTRWRTREVTSRLNPLRTLPGDWTIEDYERPDGKHLIAAYRDCDRHGCSLPYQHDGEHGQADHLDLG